MKNRLKRLNDLRLTNIMCNACVSRAACSCACIHFCMCTLLVIESTLYHLHYPWTCHSRCMDIMQYIVQHYVKIA